MKKSCFGFFVYFFLFFTSCGAQYGISYYTSLTPLQMAEVIIAEQTSLPPMQSITPKDDFFWTFINNRYHIHAEDLQIQNGAVFYAGGVLAAEVAVFSLAEASDALILRSALIDFVQRRRVVFGGYAPTQAALLGESLVKVHGNFVALLVVEETKTAEASFLACFGENPPNSPNNDPSINNPSNNDPSNSNIQNNNQQNHNQQIDTPAPPPSGYEITHGIYDPEAILQAWLTSDLSNLTEINRKIFDFAATLITNLITEDMGKFEKQTAIHDWIVDHAAFDLDFFDGAKDGLGNPLSYHPYGLFYNQTANCFGFAYTFELLMRLLGFDVLTVHGTALGGVLHAWNIIFMYDAWFAVDITWNNPADSPRLGRTTEITHRFFNVTSEKLFFYGHRWDRTAVPEATGTR